MIWPPWSRWCHRSSATPSASRSASTSRCRACRMSCCQICWQHRLAIRVRSWCSAATPAAGKTAADETLLNELEALAADRHLRALWDQTLPVPNFTRYQIVVWNTAWLELPTSEETSTAHLHEELTPRQRAGRAIYGLAIDSIMQVFTSRPQEQSMLVVEECYDWMHSAAGAKATY